MVDATPARLEANTWRYSCETPTYSFQDMLLLQERNCRMVRLATKSFAWADSAFYCNGMMNPWTCLWHTIMPDDRHDWKARSEEALRLCNASQLAVKDGSTGDMQEAVRLAINAWGSVLMDGDQCCSVPHPPYCRGGLHLAWSGFALTMPFMMFFLVSLFLCSLGHTCKHWLQVLRHHETNEIEEIKRAGTQAEMPVFAERSQRTGKADRLEVRMWSAWQASSLGGKGDIQKGLPNSQCLGQVASRTFGELGEIFDFQEDSVCSQFDHLISLVRSHCAMVADRRIEAQGNARNPIISEEGLLVEAIADLHGTLLEGFHGWRERLERSLGKRRTSKPTLCATTLSQVRENHCLHSGDAKAAQQLIDIGVYLLVWGEAGNLRFMPELIYFLADSALTAGPENEGRGLYDLGPRGRSCLYLSRVVRPIYEVVFDEWHTQVDIAPNGKDAKKLKTKFQRYLPPDVSNYDDWNELFYDPARLAETLVLDMPGADGADVKLFSLPPGERFAALRSVNWRRSLSSAKTKTHREVHSMWGVYASIHRVVLLHVALFLACIFFASAHHETIFAVPSLGGQSRAVRFATIGLLVPIHGFSWHYARWEVTGAALSINTFSNREILRSIRTLLCALAWLIPALTYAWTRYMEASEGPLSQGLRNVLLLHYAVSAIGIGIGLFIPVYQSDMLWPFTPTPLRVQFGRYFFWFVVLGVKTWLSYHGLIRQIYHVITEMRISRVMREASLSTLEYLLNPSWSRDVLEESALWLITFFLFLADTQFWFTIGCTVLGVLAHLKQRGGACCGLMTEDASAAIPDRFKRKVLSYLNVHHDSGKERMPMAFIEVWDRIVEWLRYEGKITNRELGDLSFRGAMDAEIDWPRLHSSIKNTPNSPSNEIGEKTASTKYRRPPIFRPTRTAESLLRKYCPVSELEGWPQNLEARWRISALARGLALPVPRPYRVPYIPGITVLIPHYGESILAVKENELLARPQKGARVDPSPLLSWLADRYANEFDNFMERMDNTSDSLEHAWPRAGTDWEQYRYAEHWDKISLWASMRMQTLWRTVAGMMLYHYALQCHFEAQGDNRGNLGLTWSPSDCFTCIVSMQMYRHFNSVQFDHANKLFNRFPDSLRVAFIDHEDCVPRSAEEDHDSVHKKQQRRYFSALIDRSCPMQPDGRRTPIYRIELPGFPILGDGKGDNQNHAIPFTRGTFVQCIDANQGAYFEQMLMLPCVLGEFRSRKPGDGGNKRIIGFPEHITSDFGSVGDFAASAEFAFGTILQRSYAVLGGRMHYGHPDIMNKEVMIQQGGVSKATKTLNLSEDIFAGMDFTLRGEGRRIRHCEYFHLAKGRDLGFNTVLAFFSKISSGCGEQLITRQTMRLGQLLPLPELLAFYYAHMGYYLTQFMVSWGLPALAMVWLMIVVNACGDVDQTNTKLSLRCEFYARPPESAVLIVASAWQYIFSQSLLVIFLLAQMAPVFAEMCLQEGVIASIRRLGVQLLTLAPVMFIFQAKIIGGYTVNELRFGGATYVATGRGLPTERRPFIGTVVENSLVPGGLYLDYARHTFYDGFNLFLVVVLLGCAGSFQGPAKHMILGILTSISLVGFSWLFAPFIFNPYQFRPQFFSADLRAWRRFFFDNKGRHWLEWFEKDQMKPKRGFTLTVLDPAFGVDFLLAILWMSVLNAKTALVYHAVPNRAFWYLAILAPPVLTPFFFCCVVAVIEGLSGRSRMRKLRIQRQSYESVHLPTNGAGSSDSEATDNEAESMGSGASCCTGGCPMIVVASGCSLFTFLDLRPLIWMVEASWRTTLIAGLVYKFFIFRVCIHLVRVGIRSKAFKKLGKWGRPFELWLWGTGMSRDVVVSSLIFWTMSPLVLLSSVSHLVCPTWSFHHLLVYRQPGHSSRDTVEAVHSSDVYGDDLDAEDSEDERCYDGEISVSSGGSDGTGDEVHFARP